MAVPFRKLVLWGVILGIPASVWLAKDPERSLAITPKLVWEFRALVVIAAVIEIYSRLSGVADRERSRHRRAFSAPGACYRV